MAKPHVVIVGGGITGLSAAYELRQHAEDFPVECTIVEASNRFGGKIQTRRENGFVMELGPDSILAYKPAGVELIRQLGVESEIVHQNPAADKTYIMRQGQLITMPPGTNMGIPARLSPFAATRLLSPGAKIRALFDLALPRGHTDTDESLGSFLRRRLGDELVERLAEPLLAGIYAGSVDELSLLATFPQFAELEKKHRSLILGSIRQRKASGAPKNRTRSPFVTLKDGLFTIVERLYDHLHEWANLLTETRVVAVSKREDRDLNGDAHSGGGLGSSGRSQQYAVTIERHGQQDTIYADAVIVACPAKFAADILKPLTPAVERLSEIPYVSTATVLLAFNSSDVKAPLDGSGFLIPRTEGRAITASTWTSTKWPHTTPRDHTLIRCYVGRAGQTEGLLESDDNIIVAARHELKEILGIQTAPKFASVQRWLGAMPQYSPGHLNRVETTEAALAISAPGVLIAGAGYRGVGIPDCIAQGRRAAKSVLGYVKGE